MMKLNILNNEELLEYFTHHSIQCYEAENDSNRKVSFDSFSMFSDFVINQSISCIFYKYVFLSKEDCIITKDNDEFDDEYYYRYKALKKYIDKYNSIVENVDFNRAFCVTLFCVYNGYIFEYEEYCDWFEKEGLETSDNALQKMIEEHENDVDKERTLVEKEIREKREEVKKIVIDDAGFQVCTNQSLRRRYAENFLRAHKEYRELFSPDICRLLYEPSPLSYFDEIWREYRYNKSNRR